MLLGCIADDLTGATDLALMLTRAGMRTVQVMGVPAPGTTFDGFDAVVVALKSRTNPVAEAIDWSLKAADVLLAAGAKQLFFKYCSTFDSTAQGNIGPVAEALLAKVGGGIALVCPAFPVNKRTVYLGNLFVGNLPLAESPMKDHPLTPMRDWCACWRIRLSSPSAWCRTQRLIRARTRSKRHSMRWRRPASALPSSTPCSTGTSSIWARLRATTNSLPADPAWRWGYPPTSSARA
jgi:Sugar-binding N-terminal domain